MGVKAFVLIQTEIEVAKTADVVAALKKLGRKVKSVDGVTGPYDIIVVIEVETKDEIDTVIEKIHAVAGVHRTVTCLAI
jgi:DNA-binding Lrp family transcriptional regulator